MVVGMDRFREYFSDFRNNYVLIGGVAASLAIEDEGGTFRLTKDFDLVLVIEQLNQPFVERIWRFIRAAGYEVRQNGQGVDARPVFYRFAKPRDKSFPVMLELFSRVPDGLAHEHAETLTSIPLDGAPASLSAIILEDEYYTFLLSGRTETGEVSHLRAEHLIALKAYAWRNKYELKQSGGNVDTDDIRKHFRDVAALSRYATPSSLQINGKVRADVLHYLEHIHSQVADNPQAYGAVNPDAVTEAIKQAYDL